MRSQQIEQAAAMAAPLFADGRRGGGDNDEVQLAEHHDVLPAVAPGEARAVAVEILDPPAVAVFAVRIPPRPRARIARRLYPFRTNDLLPSSASAVQIQLPEGDHLAWSHEHLVAAKE